MSAPWPELAGALSGVLDKIDRVIRDGGYAGPPITMYLAGGLAVNYHCGLRYTEDIDASFSHRVLLPYDDLTAEYLQSDGRRRILHFDANYNPTFALMHPDFEQDSVSWNGIGNERRKVELRVLSPLDLAVSKIARASDRDREDIRALAAGDLIREADLMLRAKEALEYYIGNQSTVRANIKEICREVAAAVPKPPDPAKSPEIERRGIRP